MHIIGHGGKLFGAVVSMMHVATTDYDVILLKQPSFPDKQLKKGNACTPLI